MNTPLSILLVDDDPTNLRVLEALLGEFGEKLVNASSGREAYLQAQAHEFAVILLDVRMPDLDGFETAALIRQWGKNRWTPIVFLTAFPDQEMVFKGYSAGAVDYLVKPVVPEVLKAKVATFVELAKRNAEVKQWAEALEATNAALQREIAMRGQAEETLRAMNQDLDRRVQERTASLASSEQEVRRLLVSAEDSRQVLAGALHDQERTAAELHALYGRLQQAREEERTTVAREIHDVLAQELTRLKLDIMWLDQRLARPRKASTQAEIRQKLAEMREVADSAINSVQHIATTLRPLVLDSLGLLPAIEWQAREFQKGTAIPCDVLVAPRGEEMSFDPDRSTALFRIVQESLTNVARHAQASHVKIQLTREPEQFIVVVQDNGCGIPSSALGDLRSLGLLGMRERCALAGGQFEIASAQGRGTSITVRIPLRNEAKPGGAKHENPAG